MNPHFDVLIIGAGPAGAAAALKAAQLGARVALVDKRRVGGTCTHTGCVPTRVLAITARLLRDIRAADWYGIQVNTPALEWKKTVARVRQVISDVQNMKRIQDKVTDLGGTVFLEGAATFVDAHRVRLADSGRELTADTIILCIGGKARRPELPGAEHALMPQELITLERLPASVAIVGSGYTGVQITTILNAFGVQVTLLEMAPNILPPADGDVARALREGFERAGVQVITGISGPSRIELLPNDHKRLIYSSDGKNHTLEVEAIILAVGWPAALEGLNLEVAGVQLERGFIATNAFLQTSVPHIFVAGDANGQDMLVQGANFEAETAAYNAVLGTTLEYQRHLLPSGGFTDPDHAGVGITEARARDTGLDFVAAKVHYSDLERAIIDHRTVGFLKLIVEKSSGTILGAHAIGENAVEVMQAVATAMAAHSSVHILAGVRFAYPTYAAIIGEVAKKIVARLEGED